MTKIFERQRWGAHKCDTECQILEHFLNVKSERSRGEGQRRCLRALAGQQSGNLESGFRLIVWLPAPDGPFLVIDERTETLRFPVTRA